MEKKALTYTLEIERHDGDAVWIGHMSEERPMETSDQEKLSAYLWMQHTDLFLKLVSLMPVIELGILAGWYKLMYDQMNFLALAAAIIGVIVMAIAWLYLSRVTVYIRYFRDEVPMLNVEKTKPKMFLGWEVTGRNAGLCVPMLCVGINFLLAIASLFLIFV
jgi:hypothetical protein